MKSDIGLITPGELLERIGNVPDIPVNNIPIDIQTVINRQSRELAEIEEDVADIEAQIAELKESMEKTEARHIIKSIFPEFTPQRIQQLTAASSSCYAINVIYHTDGAGGVIRYMKLKNVKGV